MEYKFNCSNCHASLSISEDLKGISIECPACKKTIFTPSPRYALGTRINDFIIDSLIGQGNMGEVYSAYHECMDRWVAIKIMKFSNEDEQAINDSLRFQNEIKTLAKFHHPHIINALFAGKHEGKDYLVMNYIEGFTLEEIIRTQTLNTDKVLIYAIQIAKAMRHAWAVDRLIHRDIKPENIMIEAVKDIAIITDLGIAKKQSSKNNLTEFKMVLGSPFYMSPEQGMDGDLDCRTDIYSLGATMYHLLCGEAPYNGLEPIQVIMTKINTDPKPLLEHKSSIPTEIVKLVEVLMHRDKEQRPCNWDETVKLLSSLRDQRRGKNHFRTGRSASKSRKSTNTELNHSSKKSFFTRKSDKS